MIVDLSAVDPLAPGRFDRYLVAPGEPLPDPAVLIADGGGIVFADAETCPTPEHRQTDGAGLSPWRCELLGLAVGAPPRTAGGRGVAHYLPLRHRTPDDAGRNLDPATVLAWFDDVVSRCRVLGNHNLKFDLEVWARAGVPAADLLWPALVDTQLRALVYDEREENHKLKRLTHALLGMSKETEEIKDTYLVGQKKDRQDWSVVPITVAADYACEDVERAIRLAAWQAPRLAADGLEGIEALEVAVLRLLVEAELRGARVDVEALQRARLDLMKQQLQVDERLEVLFDGASVNVESPKELGDAVQYRLALPILARSEPTEEHPAGEPKFDDATLMRYVRDFPQRAELFWNVRRSRRLYHQRTAFVEPYLERLDGDLLHANFYQMGARTGRMSCKEPNLQQVPPDERWPDPTWPGDPTDPGATWLAPGARKFFVPREGHALVFWDYSQVEYRFFVHYANVPALLDAYREQADLDIHAWVAREVFGGKVDRDAGKHGNYGALFGMGKDKAARYLASFDVGVTVDEAAAMLEVYHRAIPARRLSREMGEALRVRGWVNTILGRKRRMTKTPRRWGEKRDRKAQRGLEPYQTLNALCQGGAADLLKDRAVAAQAALRPHGGELLLLIHDELVAEVPAELAYDVARGLRPTLETFADAAGAPRLRVPLYVDVKVATERWSDAVELETDAQRRRRTSDADATPTEAGAA